MEQLCEPGDVIISEYTFKRAKQYIDAHPLGPKQVKGVSFPITVYKLAGLRNAPASSIFRTRDRLQALSGREEEINSLLAALADADRGEAHVTGVIGEAGVGKS